MRDAFNALEALRVARDMPMPPPPPNFTANDKLVLIALILRCDASGACWPSVARLAKDTWLGRTAVKASIRRLQALGVLDVQTRRRDDTSEPDSNLYRIRIEVGHQTTGVGRHATDLGHDATDSGSPDGRPVGRHATGGRSPRDHKVLTEVPIGSTHGRTPLALTLADGPIPTHRQSRRETSPEHRELVAHFVALYEAARQTRPEITAKDRVAANRLLGNGRSVVDAKAILERAFATDFVRVNKPDLAYIAANVNSFIGVVPAKANGLHAVQPSAPNGERAFAIGRGT
jgi:hypothetical protein